MKKLFLIAIFSLSAAFVVAQQIPDQTEQGGATVDGLNPDEAEARIKALDKTIVRADKALETETQPCNQVEFINERAEARRERDRLRRGLAGLSQRQSNSESRIRTLQQSDQAQNKRLNAHDAALTNIKSRVTAGEQRISDLELAVTDKDFGLKANSARSKAAKADAEKAQEDAKEANSAANSKAPGWIVWVVLALALLAVWQLISGFTRGGRGGNPSPTATPPTAPTTNVVNQAPATPAPAQTPAPAAANPAPAGPTITNISIDRGSMTGGDSLIIDGSNFDVNDRVEFKELMTSTLTGATGVIINPTRITCTTPAVNASGDYMLVVTKPNGGTVEVPFTFDP